MRFLTKLTICSVASLLLLTGCKSQNNDTNIIKDLGQLKELVLQNIGENEELSNIQDDENDYEIIGKESFRFDQIVDSSFASLGLLVTQNSAGYVGFFSLDYNQFLIKPVYASELLSYNVYSNSKVGYVLKFNYQEADYYYDSYGNELAKINYKKTGGADIVLFKEITVNRNVDFIFNYTLNVINGETYITYFVDMAEYYGKYEKEGNIIRVNALPKQEIQVPDDSDSYLSVGENYEDLDRIDLADYNLDGYSLSQAKNLIFSVYQGAELVNTFSLPKQAEKYALVDGQLIYQITSQLNDHIEAYDYIDEGLKYNYFSYSVDLLTGNINEIDLSYLLDISSIEDTSPFVIEEEHKYLSVRAKAFNNDKTLDSTPRNYIIAKNGKVMYDATALFPLEMKKLDDEHYFNDETQILYDKDLKEIAYLDAMDPVIDYKNRLIKGRIDGRYGYIDFDGVTRVDFKYSTFTKDKSGFIIGKYIKPGSGKVVFNRIELATSKEFYIGDNLTKVSGFDHLYYSTAEGITKFYTPNQTFSELFYDVSAVSSIKPSAGLENTNYLFVALTSTSGLTEVSFAETKRYNNEEFMTLGEEKTENKVIGYEKETAITVATEDERRVPLMTNNGQHKIFIKHHGKNNYGYRFETEATTKAYLIKDGSRTIMNRNYYISDGNEVLVELDLNTYSLSKVVYSDLYIREHRGQDYEFPYGVNEGLNNIVFSSYSSIYTEFTAPSTGKYSFKTSYSSSSLSLVNATTGATTVSSLSSLDLSSGQTVLIRLTNNTQSNDNLIITKEFGQHYAYPITVSYGNNTINFNGGSSIYVKYVADYTGEHTLTLSSAGYSVNSIGSNGTVLSTNIFSRQMYNGNTYYFEITRVAYEDSVTFTIAHE